MMCAPKRLFHGCYRQPLLSAWRAQIAAFPGAHRKHPLTQQELLPRFATYYRTLQDLPRRRRRALQRQWKQSLAGMALLLTLGQAPALAATINVAGGCTLINAINSANSDAAIGRCPAGSGADTIVLPAGSTQTLTAVNNTIYEATGLPIIRSRITLQGNNSTIMRPSGAPEFRIFAVNSSGNLTLQQTTVSGGRAAGPLLGLVGGGIFNYSGTVTLTDSVVSRNYANTGGGIYSRGTLALSRSTVSSNSARYVGGIANNGRFTLTNSRVSGNSASNFTGGVHNFIYGTLTLINSTVSGNIADRGGGMFNTGTLTLTDSTVSGNSADFGGGMYNAGSLTLADSTVSGNFADFGGGIRNRSILTLTNTTVSGNSASYGGGVSNRYGTLTLNRSLISGNTSTLGVPEISNYNGYYYISTVNANNFNLFGHSGDAGIYGFTTGSRDLIPAVSQSAILSPLVNNSGSTSTHALVRGSPAVDAAGASCSATDQRGVTRPQGAACDIGAFELTPTRPTTCGGAVITIFGSPVDDTLTGTAGIDVIHGLEGNDTLNGLAGNDILCGGAGDDNLIGAFDNDRLFGEAGVDSAQFFSATTGVTVNLTTGSSTGLGSDTLIGIENVLGTSVADILIGNGGANVLNGAAGNDLLTGALGNDTLIGGTGVDTAQFFGNIGVAVNLTTGRATGLGSDTLSGIENLTGSNMADTMVGNSAANVLNGGAANDTLYGLGGNDTLLGGAGDDAMNGGANTDICNGQTGVGDSAIACETVIAVP